MSWLARLFGRAPAEASAPPSGAVPVTTAGGPPRVVVTEAMVRAGFPRCADPAAWAKALTGAFARFPAYAPLGAACIIAKAQVETGGLTRWDEDLYYTSEAQVRRMFGARAGANPAALLRNPRALGDQVYAALGGYDARGGGIVQLTGLANQQAFADWLGLSLAEARTYMRTIPGAAMTGPWYVSHFGGLEAANRGDMREVLRIVAGKSSMAGLAAIWDSIHGDQQMAAFQRWRGLLGR